MRSVADQIWSHGLMVPLLVFADVYAELINCTLTHYTRTLCETQLLDCLKQQNARLPFIVSAILTYGSDKPPTSIFFKFFASRMTASASEEECEAREVRGERREECEVREVCCECAVHRLRQNRTFAANKGTKSNGSRGGHDLYI